MLKKIIFVIPLLMLSVSIYSQSDINSYKYVIVPRTFDFLKSEDQFQLNSLSKFMFNKYGFETIFDNEPLPEDLIKNGCLALNADVIKESGMFMTKLVIELTNCRKQMVYKSQVGDSDHKKSEIAYKMALREAFNSFENLNYKFESVESNETVIEKPVVKTAVASQSISSIEINKKEEPKVENTLKVLYAKPISNGYVLQDDVSKVVYTLIFSGKEGFYMVKGIDAVVYKLNDEWVIAESLSNDLKVETLNIKF